jgi:phosphate transport system permease protein
VVYQWVKVLFILKKKSNPVADMEKWVRWGLFICASISIAVTILIVLSVFFESVLFFKKIPITDFIFGTKWSPQSAGAFGAIPVFMGTMLITVIAMVIATPLGLFSAIYLSEYASRSFRAKVKPVLEVLAGVPTVVYGYFAVITIAPLIRGMGESVGLDIASESALAAGLVMGIMIIPFILSLSDDVINSVPNSLRDASLALGATKAETVNKVVLPAAFPGIMSAVLLGISRAVGETMIVVMAAGLSANLTANPFEAVTTVTVQIVTLLTGDQQFDSPKTLAAFALGLSLFIVTLVLNIIALKIVKKYKEQYD